MRQEFILEDYIKMQNQINLRGIWNCPCAEVVCYADDKHQTTLRVWYDEVDVPIVERCKNNLFIKAYSENGREGVQTQTSPKINLTEFGYGVDSTVALRRLIVLYANGWRLELLEDKELDVFPKDDNHLDLRRENLVTWNGKSEYGVDAKTELCVPVIDFAWARKEYA